MNNTSYIHVGWLVDGTGRPVQKKVLLRIVDGRFASIEPFSQALGVDPSAVIDLSHCTLVPPLVDSHVHLFMSAASDSLIRQNQLVAGYEELRPVIAQHLHYLFTHGVLTVRDGGDRGGFALKYRSEQGSHPEMVIKTAGQAWHSEGRYGGLIGRYPGIKGIVKAYEEDCEQSDCLKLVMSGLNSLKQYGKETAPQFTAEEVANLVKAAARKGQKVMVHANGQVPVRIAVDAGCHSIEHGFFMGRENLQRMADKGTRWVPTVYTMKAFAENLNPAQEVVDLQVIEKNVHHQLEQLQAARELGVEVVLGTDAGSLGVLHGESMVEEMKLFKKAGFSIAEIIRCASLNGAKLLGLEGDGTLTVGSRATFLVSRGAPSQLPRKLSYLEDIYTDGSPSEFYRKNPFKYT